MRIALVSTYPPTQCGIATYTQKLLAALQEQTQHEFRVIADLRSTEQMNGRTRILPVFPQNGDFAPLVLDALERFSPDVVHFQHAGDIFGLDRRFLSLSQTLQSRGIRVVTTLHTVYSLYSGLLERKPWAPWFHKTLGQQTSAVVVHHEESCRQVLLKQGLPPDKVHTIPHGTDVIPPVDPLQARGALGLPLDGSIALAFGFIHVQKNLHVLLKAWPHVARVLPEAHLVIAGKVQNRTWYNLAYERYLRRLAGAENSRGRVVFLDRFVEDREVALLFGASDVALFPYAQGYGSASGALHLALAAGSSVLCSRIPKFEEVTELAPHLAIHPHRPKLWAKGMIELMESKSVRDQMTRPLLQRTSETIWPRVAQSHIALYERLL